MTQSMGRLHHVHLLADYNRWMNGKLFAVCAEIADDQRKREMGAFFGSIHGTLNPLLLVDRLWMGRFLEEPFEIVSPAQELYADFDALRREREMEDERIRSWTGRLTDGDLDRTVSYVSAMDRQPRRFRLEDALLHLFHHQTHHRGQVSTLVGQLGYDFGDTDLAFMPGVPR